MRRNILLVLCCMLWLGMVHTLPVEAKEPDPPDVDIPLSAEKEAWIQDLAKLKNATDIFKEVRKDDVFYEQDFFNKAVYVAFQKKKKEALEYALNFLKLPRHNPEGESTQENRDFHVAKGILRVFPDLSNGHLKQIYRSADVTTKGNIISVLGKMADSQGQTVKKLLLDALNDQNFYEEVDPEIMGEPLRICDAAYNQLVLRYSIQGVLRTIGNVHDIQTRNYHIERLKTLVY